MTVLQRNKTDAIIIDMVWVILLLPPFTCSILNNNHVSKTCAKIILIYLVYLWVKEPKVWMYSIPEYNHHPCSLKGLWWSPPSNKFTDFIKKVSWLMNFIWNLPPAKSNVYIIPVWSHQVKCWDRHWLISEAVVCSSKGQKSISSNLPKQEETWLKSSNTKPSLVYSRRLEFG